MVEKVIIREAGGFTVTISTTMPIPPRLEEEEDFIEGLDQAMETVLGGILEKLASYLAATTKLGETDKELFKKGMTLLEKNIVQASEEMADAIDAIDEGAKKHQE